MSEPVFRLARPGEGPAITAFINSHFDMRLPLLNRPELYHYYYESRGDAPQFAVAEQDGRYLSAAGFIFASDAPCPDVWVSIWVAAKGRNGVGLELMSALPELLGARVVACNNIRANTCVLYQFLGWTAERMGHYYRLGRLENFTLAAPAVPVRLPAARNLRLEKVPDTLVLDSLGMPDTPHTPRKDLWYLRRRYFAYPHLTYDVWAAMEHGRLLAYVVTRTVTATDTGCVPVVRLVDFIGPDEVLPRLGGALDDLLRETGAEYMDCYNAGIPSELWQAAGFCERREGDGTIIPNYLTPPLRNNTEYYYFTSDPEQFVLFKADGDQDRANLPCE